jgi:integrase
MGRTQEGYLRKRFGAWHLSYYITENGQRKLKSHRLCDDNQTKSQAKQLRNEFLRTQVNIGSQNTGPVGVVAFWDEVYLPFIESSGKLKPATVHGYKQVFKQHLKSHFGTLTLSEYRTHNMSLFLTSLAKTLRPRTLNNVKWIASAIFDHAVATGQCDNNPIRDAKVLGKTLPDGVTGSYTLEEMENIISALVENVAAQLVMALSFFAGMRKGEIAVLQWGDIDANYIHIRRAVSRGIVGTPKSVKSLRAIPIIQPVRGLLKLQRAKSGDGVWVFPNTEGGALHLDLFATTTIKPALLKAGLIWKGYHAGRRGLGSELRSLTGDSTAGRDVLGHATTQVTEQHYEARLPETALKGMKLLEAKSLGK